MSGYVWEYKGEQYRKVKRGALRGEKVVCDGNVGTLRYTDGVYNIVDFEGSYNGRDAWYVIDCWVLEPLEEPTVDGTQASEQVIEMLANLARRVTQLESQLAATQRNVETWAGQTESNTQDIAMLDERTYPKEAEITPDESIPQYWSEMVIKLYGGTKR